MGVPPAKGYNAYYDNSKRCDNADDCPHSRQRFKPEAPLGQQLRTASPSDPDHQRRIRALQGLVPEDDNEQDGHNRLAPTTQEKSHKERHGLGASANDDATSEPTKRNRSSAVPDLGDLLNNFKVPDGPRVFKSEPVDLDVWDSMLAENSRPKKKQKKDKLIIPAQPVAATQDLSSKMSEVRNRLKTPTRPSPGTSAGAASTDVVDLTAEDPQPEENSAQPPVAQAPTQVPTSSLPRPLTAAQVHMMDQIAVPQDIRQQAVEIYQRENTALPVNIKKWAQLKAFVAQHPASFISPQLCLIAQAHAFTTASAPSLPRPLPVPVADNAVSRQLAEPRPALQASASTNDSGDYHVRPPAPQIKVESEDTDQTNRHDKADADRSPHNRASPAGPLKKNRRRASPRMVRPTTHAPQPPTTRSTSSSTITSPTRIQELIQPSDLMPDILPPGAPKGYPHLIQLWDPALLNLPLDQHDHLNIQDTVVSVLAKYDLKTKSVISAFLDVEKVNHFFFLFKARESNLHSWSIEREEDVITIGIERPTRAPNLNTTDQSRPSSGQYDLTIQYRMLPSPSMPPPPRVDPSHISSTDRERHVASHSQSEHTKLPARWTLINKSIFPSSPDISTFLHHTPPTRGADEHSTYMHPSQSACLPTSNLSIFSRYLQQSIFKSSVIEAEIQVAYGRKVRYDAVLGRVRVLWDYALKGARTQREKRERGEYNRPSKNKKHSAEEGADHGHRRGKETNDSGREVPGSGLTGKWLSRNLPLPLEGRGTPGTLVEGEDVGGIRVGVGAEKGEHQERMRKRVKMERTGGEHEESASEYSDGSASD